MRKRTRHRKGTLGDWLYRRTETCEATGLTGDLMAGMRHNPDLPEFGSLAEFEDFVSSESETYCPELNAAAQEIWRRYCAWKWPHLKPEEVRVRWVKRGEL